MGREGGGEGEGEREREGWEGQRGIVSYSNLGNGWSIYNEYYQWKPTHNQNSQAINVKVCEKETNKTRRRNRKKDKK